MDKVAVLIPCYNEALTIGKVIQDFKSQLPEAVFYVYDNNSTDDTAKIALEHGAHVRRVPQQGKGNVIRAMFREIQAHAYLMIDGDDTYPAENARSMVAAVLNDQVDMVIGDRLSSTYFNENKRPFHNFGNRLVRGLINYLFKNEIRDIMTGYRAFSYSFVKTFPVLSSGFEIETEMTIHALDKKLNIQNMIVDYRDRPDGSESKLNTYSDGFRVLRTIARLFKNYKPLIFFTLVALILAIVSLALFVPVWDEYRMTGLVERFPTMIVSGFVALTALVLLVSGIILDVIAQQERKQFELQYIRVRTLESDAQDDKHLA